MDEIDKEALTRALELTKAEPEHAEQVNPCSRIAVGKKLPNSLHGISNAKTYG